ncbi:mavicyanin [Solanum pennellii]|uniref:Mavicyanin n=1 Tax=Solanum pennellii TaxID=28526 RepID=A0ABM1FEA6_SOLPN|nr:mavicyanin [Solanum pennellii]
MAFAAIFLFILFASPIMCYGKDHIVGGSDGWSQSGDYSTWASTQTFIVGDNLVFNYGGSHGVNVVSKDDYDNCNTGNALLSYTGGQNSIPLSSAGDMYFVCPTLNHCDTGMKLAIKVEGTSSATTPATPYGTKSMPHNAASGTFGTMSKMVFGFSLALFVFMG